MRCPTCSEADLAAGTATLDCDLAGVHFEASVPAQTCPVCGEAQVEDAVRRAFDRAVGLRIAACAPSGEGLRWVRKHVGLRLPDLAEVMGVPLESVSNWETGEQEVPRAVWLVLGALVLEQHGQGSNTRARARQVAGAPTRGETIRLQL